MHVSDAIHNVLHKLIRRLQTRIYGVFSEELHREVLRCVEWIGQKVLIRLKSLTHGSIFLLPCLHGLDSGMSMTRHVKFWNYLYVPGFSVSQDLAVVFHCVETAA